MTELIEDGCIEGTIITSRNFQESFRIQAGESNYAILAGFMEVSQQQIEMFAEFCGEFVGCAAINKQREREYRNDKNKLINFANRNIYQNPVKTRSRHLKEELFGTATSVAVESAIKQGARGFYRYLANKANYQSLEQVYSFLQNYAMTDNGISNSERTQLELAKIRNGFPLSDKSRKKMYENTKGKTVISLGEIPTMSVLNNNSQLCEALTYFLFDLFCHKFGDDDGILASSIEKGNFDYVGMKTLFNYYDYLGFTGSHAKEIIRTNARRYDNICRDQTRYLQLGRAIVRELSFDLPGVDRYRIQEHCNQMAQCDPYQLRRKKVQNVTVGAFESMAGICLKRPDIVFSGGALALSQFRLEDGNIPTIMQRELKKNGIDINSFDLMLSQAKKIKERQINMD